MAPLPQPISMKHLLFFTTGSSSTSDTNSWSRKNNIHCDVKKTLHFVILFNYFWIIYVNLHFKLKCLNKSENCLYRHFARSAEIFVSSNIYTIRRQIFVISFIPLSENQLITVIFNLHCSFTNATVCSHALVLICP